MAGLAIVSEILVNTGLYNSLSRQAITRANTDILLITSWGIYFNEIWLEIQKLSFGKMMWKCRLQNGGHFVQALILINM